MSAIDTVIETVLTVFFWVVQIGITMGLALLLGLGMKKLEGAVRRKPGHLIPWVISVFAVLCALLASLALNPPVVCPKEYEDVLTSEVHEAVQSVSRGIYSDRLPLVPAYVKITEIQEYVNDGEEEQLVYFDINYLYFGQRGMFWSSLDGYDQVKQLFGY